MEIEQIEKGCASSSPVEKEKIVLHALTGGHVNGQECGYSEFYTIDMRKREVSQCSHALINDLGFSTMVSLGSVIYVIGSVKYYLMRCKTQLLTHSQFCGHLHKHMSYLDLDNDNGDGWKEGPCSSEDLVPNPVVLVFGGKIYDFHFGQSSLAHVFDPLSNKWETLLPPPSEGNFHISCHGSAQVDSQNNRILVHFSETNSLFAYYPPNNQWELLLKYFHWSPQHVFGDGVVFVYLPDDTHFLMAYHVDSKQWLNIVFTSEFPDNAWKTSFDALFHLGGNLMCFATYSSYESSPPGTRVYLFKFRFERSPHNLLITPLPEESYIIGTCSAINRFFPI